MAKNILYVCMILISLGFVFYLYNKKTSPQETLPNTENTEDQSYKTIEEASGLYKFDIPLEGVNVEAGTDNYTTQSSYQVHVESETTGAISTEGTLNIYTLKNIKWEDFYTQLQGQEGMNSGGITPEKIQEGFKNAIDCTQQDEPSITPCHADNKFGKTYIRVEKTYNRGEAPTGVFYIYKLSEADYTIAYYEYSPRHSRANDFEILQEIAESIR